MLGNRSNVSTFILGAISVLVVTGLSKVVYNKIIRKRAAPALSPAETRAILKAIISELGTAAESCINLAKVVQDELSHMMGPMPSEEDMMRTYVFPTFREEYYKVQDRILGKEFNACDWELEEAIEEYGKDDGEIAELAKELATILKKFGGGPQEAAGAEGGEGAEGGGGHTIGDVVNELANRILTGTNAYCQQWVDTHGIPSTQEEQGMFVMGLQEDGERAQADYIKELGIRPEDFQNLLMKSQNNPEVQQAFMQISQGIPAILKHHKLQM
jgi:hypothetical protein